MAGSIDFLIQYRRTGGRLPPRDRERLNVYPDGSFEMWRSVGAASRPPSPIGRFMGRVPGDLLHTLTQLAQQAAVSGDLEVKPPPDASVDFIQVAGAKARMGRNEQLAGAWGELANALRQALGSLTDQPAAALALHIDPSGLSARLLSQGAERLRVALGDLQVRAVLWDKRQKQGDWRWKPDAAGLPGEVEARPGWSFELPFDHGFAAAPGMQVAAYVNAGLYDGDHRIPVSLEARVQV
jgi:hypothetical protein